MTIYFKNAYIKNAYSVVGRNEYDISIKGDLYINDYYLSKKSFEQGESELLIKSISGLLSKCKKKETDIDVALSGDLQNQILASTLAYRNFNIPFLGLYSACATFCEGLIIGSNLLENKGINNIIISTSANNLASEKQFRFPIEYGAIRKYVNTFTATAAVSTLLTKEKTEIKIESATIGTVVDIGYNDANNFGAVMALSASKTISEHLKETNRSSEYYDIILTGDLGVYGVEILKELLRNEYKINATNIVDAGSILLKDTSVVAGGSGPVCLPLILFNKILKEKYKKILLVATGALHSKTSVNLKESIPNISHVVSLEVL